MSQHCSNVCGTDFWCNFYCGIAEDVYYAGVVDFGGDFYNSGQDQACERCCCR
jgi:hypothetical protein